MGQVMAVHEFTGVTGRIQVNGSLVAFVSGDVTMSVATGKYTTLNTNKASKNTRGLQSVSGSLKRAWGVNDNQLYDLMMNNTEFLIEFDNDGATGAHTYKASGCVLTELSIEGLEAGSEGALMINASFEGLSFGRD